MSAENPAPVRRAGLVLAAMALANAMVLVAIIDRGPLADLTSDEYARLRTDIIVAESTGLKPKLFDPLLSPYLNAAFAASAWG
jgi:hypothetical protein